MRGPGTVDVDLDVTALERALRERVDGEVRFDAGSRAAYATDASNYRQVPLGVVVPRNVEAGAEAGAGCARYDAPVLSRGGGTSLGGQCTNAAVVIDWTKYCNRFVSVGTERRTCVVEPGTVLDELDRQLSGTGLKFGPKPATHSHCSLGGMIGSNSCGGSAQAYGKTANNVRRLESLQTHCHQGLKYDADRELMRRAGIEADVLDGGCYGLAGDFGFADGFSCRTQIEQGGTGRQAMHPAEVLALGLDGPAPAHYPEKLATRPRPSARDARLVTSAVAAAAAASAVAALRAATRRRRPPRG